MFYVVERSIVVIKPKQPLLDWINANLAISEGTMLTLESIRIDCNSYLIPEVDAIEDGINYVDNNFEALFHLELASWSEDQNTWPNELSLKMFWEWFDIEISPTLIDLTDENDAQSTTEDFDESDESPETIH